MAENLDQVSGLLRDALILVTGAGQGNGRAIALGVAAAGATVIVTDVSVTPPDVVMFASANRVLPLHRLVMFTRVSPVALMASTRSASAFACSRDSSGESSLPLAPRAVD